MYYTLLITHIIALEISAGLAIIKAILLWIEKKEAFRKLHQVTSIPIKILFAIGLITGIVMIHKFYDNHIPEWLLIKFGIIICAIGAVLKGERSENKYWMALAALGFLLVILQANVKAAF
jgi:uncharacterized membrane protein SirB2